uniref:Electron transport complex protein RnfA n=1 Tax=Gracilinema caldarium TaxID=215591 RepID=A0A7C3E0M3_9SPIR
MQFLLYICSSFVLFNGLIQGGFGLEYAEHPKNAIIPIFAMIFSSLVSWPIVHYVLAMFGFGVFGVFLVFPISVVSCVFIVKVSALFRGNPHEELEPRLFSGFNGIAFFSAFQTVLFAQTALQALLFALGGAVGFVCIIMIVSGIQKRSDIEAVPQFFMGQPLLLVSTGLVSLIFTELLPMVIHLFTR